MEERGFQIGARDYDLTRGFPLRLGGDLQHMRLFFFLKKADPRALFGADFCAKLTQPGGRGGNVIRI